METLDVKATELSPAQRSAIEELLGRALEESETVGLRVFPDSARVEQARKALLEWLQIRQSASEQSSEDEIGEEIITEAMRSVRPGYRPVS
jgi:hypothetical protein